MTTVHCGGFDAERSWRPAGLATLPAVPDPHADRIVAAMDELLAVRCLPGDVLATAGPMSPALIEVLAAAGVTFEHRVLPLTEDLAGCELAPYAVVPGTAELVARLGLRATLPDVATVAKVSSKTWSNDLVHALGLPGGGTIIRSVAELRHQVVVKDPYGVAGRGALLLSSPGQVDTVARVLQRQVDRGARIELLVQPWYDKEIDLSAHFVIAPDGQVEWLGVQQIDNEEFGYRGSRAVTPEVCRKVDEAGYRDTMTEVAAALWSEGYHGPVCVDSMLLRDGSLIPVLEINPRVSMGLLSLCWQRRLLDQRLSLRFGRKDIRLHAEPSDLIGTLAEDGLVTDLRRPGLLPLSTGTLLPPRGRFYYAVVSASAEQDAELEAGVARAA